MCMMCDKDWDRCMLCDEVKTGVWCVMRLGQVHVV